MSMSGKGITIQISFPDDLSITNAERQVIIEQNEQFVNNLSKLTHRSVALGVAWRDDGLTVIRRLR